MQCIGLRVDESHSKVNLKYYMAAINISDNTTTQNSNHRFLR